MVTLLQFETLSMGHMPFCLSFFCEIYAVSYPQEKGRQNKKKIQKYKIKRQGTQLLVHVGPMNKSHVN